MKKIIENFKYSNYLLSKVLKEERLVINDDTIFEISNPLNNAISFHFGSIFTSVFTDIDFPEIYHTLNNRDNINFIFNGDYSEDIKKLATDRIDEGSFHIGICTDDELEYRKTKAKYQALRKYLVDTFDVKIDELEKDIENHKVYMLSYRHK